MYVSFKYGEFEGMRNGRYFTDMTEKSLDSLIGSINESAKCGIACIKRSWMTRDVILTATSVPSIIIDCSSLQRRML